MLLQDDKKKKKKEKKKDKDKKKEYIHDSVTILGEWGAAFLICIVKLVIALKWFYISCLMRAVHLRLCAYCSHARLYSKNVKTHF